MLIGSEFLQSLRCFSTTSDADDFALAVITKFCKKDILRLIVKKLEKGRVERFLPSVTHLTIAEKSGSWVPPSVTHLDCKGIMDFPQHLVRLRVDYWPRDLAVDLSNMESLTGLHVKGASNVDALPPNLSDLELVMDFRDLTIRHEPPVKLKSCHLSAEDKIHWYSLSGDIEKLSIMARTCSVRFPNNIKVLNVEQVKCFAICGSLKKDALEQMTLPKTDAGVDTDYFSGDYPKLKQIEFRGSFHNYVPTIFMTGDVQTSRFTIKSLK